MMLQLFLNSLYSGILYLLLGLSFHVIYSTFRFFHIVHAVFLTFGAYFVFTIFNMGVNIWCIAVPLSITVAVFFILIVNKSVYVPLLKLEIPNWQMMIVSLGLYVVLQNIISIFWGDGVLSFRKWEIKAGYEFLDAYITSVQAVTFITCIVLLFGWWLIINRTTIGKKIKAVSSSHDLSLVLGISENLAMNWSLALGTGMAVCAGILIAADIDMTPTMGFDWLMYGVVAMIIGGMGKMKHMVFGALLLAVAQHLSAYFFDSKWMNATAYIILVIFLYFRPFGFSGKKLKKTEV